MNFNNQAKAIRKQIRYILELIAVQGGNTGELVNLMKAQAYLYQAIHSAALMGMVSFEGDYVDSTGVNWTKGEN